MVSSKLLQWLVQEEASVVPALFKPVQFLAIRKLAAGKRLSDNEKRYVRGKMKKKLDIMERLSAREWDADGLKATLSILDTYYITGLAALKYHGYGWYYDVRVIEVINTKIEGMLRIEGQRVKFIRAKSIARSKVVIDKETGLKYATNEQIIRDVSLTKNQYTKMVWTNMAERYRRIFSKRAASRQQKINYAQYGV